MNYTVNCGCNIFVSEVPVVRFEKCQAVTVNQLMLRNLGKAPKFSVFIQDQNRIVTEVGCDDAFQALVVSILLCRRMSICKD